MADAQLLGWIEERVSTILKVKADAFKRMVSNADASEALLDFINHDDVLRVFFIAGAKEITSYEVPPANTKKKVAYLLKPHPLSLTPGTVDRLVLGDISPKLLENMYGVLEGVYLPIMSNSLNQKGWPEVMSG